MSQEQILDTNPSICILANPKPIHRQMPHPDPPNQSLRQPLQKPIASHNSILTQLKLTRLHIVHEVSR